MDEVVAVNHRQQGAVALLVVCRQQCNTCAAAAQLSMFTLIARRSCDMTHVTQLMAHHDLTPLTKVMTCHDTQEEYVPKDSMQDVSKLSSKHTSTAKQTARCSTLHWRIQLRQGGGQIHAAVRAGRNPAVSGRVGLCPAPSSLHAGHITQVKVSCGSCIPQGFCHHLCITTHLQSAHVAHDWRTLTWQS